MKKIEISFTEEEWQRIEEMALKRKDKDIYNAIKQAVDFCWFMKFTKGHDIEEFYKE